MHYDVQNEDCDSRRYSKWEGINKPEVNKRRHEGFVGCFCDEIADKVDHFRTTL